MRSFKFRVMTTYDGQYSVEYYSGWLSGWSELRTFPTKQPAIDFAKNVKASNSLDPVQVWP